MRGDKTHNAGNGTHCGWLPAHNPLFCASGLLGTCLLYRLLARLEPFPKVTEERRRNYKWLPLIIDATATFSLDVQKALLPLRPVGAVPQNACWNQLYSLAGYEFALGDAVTHVGRAAAHQEAEDAMLPAAVVNEALGYSNKEAKKDHYTPQMPLAFQLQRAGFSFDVQDFQEADAAHLRALRAHPAVVKDLIDRLLPELCAQEECVARIRTTAKSTDRKAVMQQKKDNRDSGVREHRYALNPVSLAWHPGTGGFKTILQCEASLLAPAGIFFVLGLEPWHRWFQNYSAVRGVAARPRRYFLRPWPVGLAPWHRVSELFCSARRRCSPNSGILFIHSS